MGNRGFYGFPSPDLPSSDFYGFSAPKAPRNPLSFPLLAWYQADLLSGGDGDVITTWSDSSGLGANATQPTAVNKPKLSLYTGGRNGLNTVRFDGSNDFLIPPISSTGGSYTMVCALNQTTAGTSRYIFDSRSAVGGAGRLTMIAGDSTNAFHGYIYYTSSAQSFISGINTTGWIILSVVLDGRQSRGSIYRNLAFLGSGSYVAQPVVSTYATLGTTYGGSSFAIAADMGEFIFFDAALNVTELQGIVTYLNVKWGIF